MGLKSTWATADRGNVALFTRPGKGCSSRTQPCGFNGTVTVATLRATVRAGNDGAALQGLERQPDRIVLYNKFDSVNPGVGYITGDRVPGAPEENAKRRTAIQLPAAHSWNGYAGRIIRT